MLDFFLSVLIAGLPVAVIEITVRMIKQNSEFWRKLIHVLSAVAVLVVTSLYDFRMLIPVSITFIFLMLVARSFGLSRSLRTDDRVSFGEVYFPAGVGLSAVFAHEQAVFVFAIACLACVDVAACVVGKRWGKRKIWKLKKTVEGSTAAFIVGSVLVAVLVPDVSYAEIILVGGGLAASELIGFKGADNLIIPVSAVLFASLIY